MIINRTLVYAALTLSLVGVYLGGVVVLQRALVFLTGEGSQLAVVAKEGWIGIGVKPLHLLPASQRGLCTRAHEYAT